MPTAINLDNDRRVNTGKIRNITFYGHLATKLETQKSFGAQIIPQQVLSFRHLLPQLLGLLKFGVFPQWFLLVYPPSP